MTLTDHPMSDVFIITWGAKFLGKMQFAAHQETISSLLFAIKHGGTSHPNK